MKFGDSVVYLADPLLYGTGEIRGFTKDGWVVVRFDDTDSSETFHPHELELLAVWVAGGALPESAALDS